MRKKLTHNFYGKIVAGLIAVALIISGLCFLGADGNIVLASDSVATKHDGGYYVKSYTADEFKAFRGENYTYPKLTATDVSDYQEWLFAGWFTDVDCTEAVESSTTTVSTGVYAKFVDADLSYIKCQVTPGTDMGSEKANVRLISTLESADYSGAGFYITYKGNEGRYPVTTIYKRLSATDDGMECGYSPIAFNADAEYLSAFQMKNIGNANFDEPIYIQSYWVTKDGTEVLGMSRYARIEDSYEKIVNVPVRMYASDAEVISGSVNIEYEADQFSLYKTDEYPNGYDSGNIFDSVEVSTSTSGTKEIVTVTGASTVAKAAEGILINLRLQLKEGATLQSNTTFTVSGESFKNGETDVTLDVSDVLFKNYPVAYSGNVDTSWYKGFEDNKTFVISSAADLYGLAEIVNATSGDYKSEQFAGQEIILGSDIIVNKGKASIDGWDTTQDANGNTISDGTKHEWTPIGYSDAYRFQGVFNGRGNTISGIYYVDDEGTDAYYGGLFGITHANSELQNFRLENSYFNSVVGWNETYALMGSVAGQLAGDAYSIYSNSYVVSANQRVGGMFGVTNPSSTTGTFYIDDCWFDGEVYATQEKEAANKYVGGIVGDHLQGHLVMTNCLNAGPVTLSYTTAVSANNGLAVGGFVGGIQTTTANASSISISNSMNTGYVVAKEGDTEVLGQSGVGSIVGFMDSDNDKVTVSNVFATTESIAKFTVHAYKGTLTGTINDTNTESDITGYTSHQTVSALGIYAYDDAKELTEEDEPLCWVVTENGTPELKSFCDEWIDVGWYYNKNYAINTAEEFYGFSAISADNITFSGITVSLERDIELNSGNAISWVAGKTEATRTLKPIVSFAGTFNGQGNRISGVYIEPTGIHVGLFGTLTGTVHNLEFTNSYVNSSYARVGSVAGTAKGAIIENVYSDAYLLGSAGYIGGIVGQVDQSDEQTTTFTNCWYDGTAKNTSTEQYNGGILGRMSKGTVKVTDCLFTGSVITNRASANAYTGGIVGGVWCASVTGHCYITDCVSYGMVDAPATTGTIQAFGSVIGAANFSGTGKPNVYMENVYSATTLSSNKTIDTTNAACGTGNMGSTSGSFKGATLNLASAELSGDNAYAYTQLTFRGSVEDTDGTGAWVATDNGPELYQFSSTKSTSTFEDVNKIMTDWYCNEVAYNKGAQTVTDFIIDDAADFKGLPVIVNHSTENFNGCTVYVNEDVKTIDLNEGWTAEAVINDDKTDVEFVLGDNAVAWNPIGKNDTVYFDGTFDGNMATIKGVYVNRSERYSGLFGYAGPNSTIKSFTLDNSYVASTAAYTGGVVGASEGAIDEIYSKVLLYGKGQSIGGIVGQYTGTSEKTISNCWFEGVVKGAARYVGGIAGRVHWGTKTIKDCLNTGNVLNVLSTDSDSCSFTGGIAGGLHTSDSKALNVTLEDCLSTGYVYSYHTGATGSVVGRSVTSPTTVSVNDVYTTDDIVTNGTRETGKAITGFGSVSVHSATITGTPRVIAVGDDEVADYDDIAGTSAYVYTGLEFWSNDNTIGKWIAIEGAAPELKSFSAKTAISSFAGVQRKSTGWYYNAFTYENVTTPTNVTTSYNIATADDMHGFSMIVNNGIDQFSEETVSLAGDIIFNDAEDGDAEKWASGEKDVPAWTDGENSVAAWIPISMKGGTLFEGVFDGGGNEISGLYMTASSDQGSGLFGCIANADVKIQNFSLVNSYLVNTNTTARMGSIVGWAQKGTIQDIYSEATLCAKGATTGGLVGIVSSGTVTINSCWYGGNIVVEHTGTKNFELGGIVGNCYSGTTNVDTCFFDGNINTTYIASDSRTAHNFKAGGMCGVAASSGTLVVRNSMSAGTIKATWVTSDACEPGTVGQIATICGCPNSKTDIATTAATTSVIVVDKNGTKAVESAAGSTTYKAMDVNSDYIGEEDYIYGLGAQVWTELAFTEDEEITVAGPIWAARAGKLPAPATLVEDDLDVYVGKVDTELSGTGTEADPYLITSVEQLYGFAKLSLTDNFENEFVALGKTITVNSGDAQDWKTSAAALPWYPIAQTDTSAQRFAGTFDGKEFEIQGIYAVNDNQYLGLFGFIDDTGKVQNLRLTNSYFKQTGEGFVGSIAGDMRGTLDTVYSDAIVESVGEQTGGIVARVNGVSYTISTSDAEATKTTTDDEGNITIEQTITVTKGRKIVTLNNCWFDGEINVNMPDVDKTYIGGITSRLVQGTANMTNCLFTGTINSTKTANTAYIGGLFGDVARQATTSSSAKEVSETDEESEVTTKTITTTVTNYIYEGTDDPAVTTANISSSISAGNIKSPIGEKTYIGAAIGLATAKDDTSKSNVKLENVFTTSLALNADSKATVTGSAVQAANQDRLMGYGTQESGDVLDFAETWTMRSNDVPVLTCFGGKVENQATLISNPDAAAMAKEIGLDKWNANAKITDAIASGEGNYLVSYDVSSSTTTYDAYIQALVALDFKEHASNVTDELVYHSTYYKEATDTTGEWVLNITYVTNESKIYISINTDMESMDDNLDSGIEVLDGTSAVSLSMVELITNRYGNSFVFQLPNGHFIISDGGYEGDADELVAYLKKLAGTAEVYIDAWVLTHYHADHAGALYEFYRTPALREGVYLQAVYASEPSKYALAYWGETKNENQVEMVNKALRGALTLQQSPTDSSRPDVYQLHMGQKYYFNGITMDVIDTQEQHHVTTWDDEGDPDVFNSSSTNCVFTLTDTGEKVLLGGDATNVNMEYIMSAYGKNAEGYGTSTLLANINIFAAYHHGKNTTATFYETAQKDGDGYYYKGIASTAYADYLLKNTNNADGFKFDAVLFPYHQVFDSVKGTNSNGTKWYIGDDNSTAFPKNMSEINAYFCSSDNTEKYYTYGYEDCVEGYSADKPHGTIQLTFTGSGITETVYASNIVTSE